MGSEKLGSGVGHQVDRDLVQDVDDEHGNSDREDDLENHPERHEQTGDDPTQQLEQLR